MSESQNTAAVEYRPIPTWPDYKAGDDGSVWSLKSGTPRMMRPFPNEDGYLIVNLRSGNPKRQKVHRLILWSFVGPCPASELFMIPKNPMQPFVKDPASVVRFKKNAIVRYLLENGGIDLNELARRDFTQDDRVQFAQLIGYSLSGFHELSYVPDEVALRATAAAMTQGFKASGCRNEGCPIHCGVETAQEGD